MVKLAGTIVALSIVSLKVAEGFTVIATAVAVSAGAVERIVGKVVELLEPVLHPALINKTAVIAISDTYILFFICIFQTFICSFL
jgi:hypothetical protein